MRTTIFRKIMTAVFAILLPAVAIAQESADTITAQTLDEIVIQAPKVIRTTWMSSIHRKVLSKILKTVCSCSTT